MSTDAKNEERETPSGVDAVVLAGTYGSKPFTDLEGREIFKPYLELGGQTLVARATRAALDARGVGRVFVVGQQDLLQQALGPLLDEFPHRLKLVAEGENIVENGLLSFFHNVLPASGLGDSSPLALDHRSLRDFQDRHPEAAALPVLAVTSDLPFIAAEDIEEFIEQVPEDATVLAGLVDHVDLENMRQVLGSQTMLDRWKLGGIPLRRREVRFNNLWMCRPLLTDPVIYALAGELYTHRWLLDQDGKVLWRNWWAILRALARFSVRLRGRLRFFRGLFNFFATFTCTALARLAGRLGRWAARPFRFFAPIGDLEFIASLLFGAPAKTRLCRSVAPSIDVDVVEVYRALAENGGENYRRVARYLGRLPHASPAKGDGPDLRVIAGGKS